jgi:hypothetical protein
VFPRRLATPPCSSRRLHRPQPPSKTPFSNSGEPPRPPLGTLCRRSLATHCRDSESKPQHCRDSESKTMQP